MFFCNHFSSGVIRDLGNRLPATCLERSGWGKTDTSEFSLVDRSTGDRGQRRDIARSLRAR